MAFVAVSTTKTAENHGNRLEANRTRLVMSILSSMRYCLGDKSDFTDLYWALGLMPLGLFFDFFDGKVARWRKKSSLMGQELDSLADLVSAVLSRAETRSNRRPRSPLALLPLHPHSPLVSDHDLTTYS